MEIFDLESIRGLLYNMNYACTNLIKHEVDIMMKGKRKKLVAWLLVLTVLMSPASGFRTFAVEPDDAAQQTDLTDAVTDEGVSDQSTDDGGISADDPNGSSEPQDPVTPDDPAAAPADEPTVTADPADPDTQADTDGTEDQEADTGDPVVEDGGLINNLFLGEKSLQAPGEQNLIVSFGDGSEQLTSVKLVLSGEDGRQSEIPLTEQKESYYRFVKTYNNNEAGTYRLVAFAYELDGHKKRIDFEKIGISAEFSVIAEEAEESSECTEEAGISVTALTSDDISDDMTEQIQSAIQEVADEAVDTVNEDAVELGTSSTDQSYGRAVVSAELTALTDQAVKLGSYSAPKAYTGPSSAVIVLDPGHGGKESGATQGGFVEKDVNLKIAQACKAELEKNTGLKVYMTRTTDKYLSLEARVAAAKTLGATLFVSIHMNSSTTSKDAKGAEVYYPNTNYNPTVSADGKAAAESILNELVDLGLSSRGVKFLNSTDDDDGEGLYSDGSVSDYYSVIRNSKKCGFPGIIVEHAFLTNEEDAKKLKNPSFLTELGKADAQGILKYCQTRTDYSAVFDFSYYTNRYSDVKKAYGNDAAGALQHFISNGMNERRQGSKEFSVDSYISRYPDLQAAFGTNYPAYYMHYINYGRKEGRIATTDGSNVNAGTNPSDNVPSNTASNTIYAGTDYGDVYDYEYYINRYGDIAAAFSGDYAGALRHFVQCGMSEGRQAKGTFNVNTYKNTYKDLRVALGDDLKRYYMHYIEYGKDEGRKASGDDTVITDPDDKKTPLDSKYSPVYDYDYYVTQYSDVRQAYGNNADKVLQHFIQHGMSEGRRGNEEFNVYGYKSRYSDLRAAFGDDLKKYYMHYIEHGQKEKRSSDLVEVKSYQGIDYSKVYDFNYYTKKYSDIYATFSNDPSGAIKHFVEFGVNEGRQASEEFNITAYKNNYADLRSAFGDNNIAYVRHFIEIGATEGRNAKSALLHTITIADGTSRTSVEQMVTYFIANNPSYPTYYSNNTTDAKTLKDFCQLYRDISINYGIKPEVAFCQAMKETNFLKFGGDVKISQFNFAGLGATGNSAGGASFKSVKEGIEAHVQHLAAYAYADAKISADGKTITIPSKGSFTCVDSRFSLVTKGCAPYVEWLGQKENPIPGKGWATAEGYGYSIINDYMNKLSTYSLL